MPRTALLVVDVQMDFLPGGSLPTPHGDQIMPHVLDLLIAPSPSPSSPSQPQASPYQLVVFSLDWHPQGHISFQSTHQHQHPLPTASHMIGSTPPPCTPSPPGCSSVLLKYTSTGKLCGVLCDDDPDQPVSSTSSVTSSTTSSTSCSNQERNHTAGTASPPPTDPVHRVPASVTCPMRTTSRSTTLLTVRQRLWPDHCVQGTVGSQLHPQLAALILDQQSANQLHNQHGNQLAGGMEPLLHDNGAHGWGDGEGVNSHVDTGSCGGCGSCGGWITKACLHIPAGSCCTHASAVQLHDGDDNGDDGAAMGCTTHQQAHQPSSSSSSSSSCHHSCDALVVYKGADPDMDSYSLFFDNGHIRQSGLHDILTRHHITCLHIVGLALDYCVLYTCLDALGLGYQVVLVEEATRPVSGPGGEEALQRMREAGTKVVNTEEALEMLMKG